ncbi:MAG: valine--tRNA ligase [Actinobacteria bacterium]|nr:valine--tRNA ligase [Actinomycetota bacterium]
MPEKSGRNETISKTYDFSAVEENIYEEWLQKNYFHAVIDWSRKRFSIVIPPPNVTGSLHMGHALNNTLQDIVVRRKRMEGLVTLWLPGTDHAGIATQNVVEREIAQEGLTRFDLGREKFIERVWQWKEKYGSTIINQLKRLGASCDWQRQRFTMDEGCSKAVRKAFVTLYNEGLIYRGKYLVNWCPRCLTALSDIEVEYVERKDYLYYIKYPLENGGYVTIATTRPETMLADTAVAVNPNDSRYKHLINSYAILPLVGRRIPIIADDAVDKEFGTGALKVTPAHDPTEYEIGIRHELDVINVLTEDGKINSNGGKFEGLSREEARNEVVKELENEGLIEKIEEFEHSVGTCYRCHTPIEPYLSTQWFVRMKPLAEKAIEVVREGKIRFHPEKYTNIYFQWLENIKDWCISRQIWWGHRIPVWYCDDCGKVFASEEDPVSCPDCGSKNIRQDEDVLDTWFSSALWPFSTLGWPEKTEDLDYFYPTDLLVTGYDIIFFWVARMIMMGLKLAGDIPFKDVYIHTLVRDEKGQKMSKSKGNVIDPVVMIEKYGADSLRFTLSYLAAPGQNIYLSEEKIEGGRNFANKIWNASRYVLLNLSNEDSPISLEEAESGFGLAEKWILTRYAMAVKNFENGLNEYDYARAVQSVYNYFWDDFCDVYLELTKIAFYRGGRDRRSVETVLRFLLENNLRLIHPIMPFITEHLFKMLKGKDATLVMGPVPSEGMIFEGAEENMSEILSLVKAIRALKADIGQPNMKDFKVVVNPARKREVIEENLDYIEELTKAKQVIISTVKEEGYLTAVYPGGEAYVEVVGGLNSAQLLKRLEKKFKELESVIAKAEAKLNNAGFINNAHPEIVEKVRNEREESLLQIKRVELLMKEIKEA